MVVARAVDAAHAVVAARAVVAVRAVDAARAAVVARAVDAARAVVAARAVIVARAASVVPSLSDIDASPGTALHRRPPTMHWLDTLLSAWRDRQRVAQSRIGVLARLVAHLAAWVFTIVFVVHGLHAPLHAPAPAPIAATAAGDVRFGLPAATRREIFNQITASENEWHTIGTSAFPTEPWSAQDHQAAFERNEIREVASLRHLHLSQVYLVLDEGIREHWPGPGNQPLPATVTPLSPRRQ